MGANPEGPMELAMTHYADGQACQRPGEVRAMVDRLLRWSGQPETCISCSSAPALSVIGREALCVRCREQRAVRMVTVDDVTRGPIRYEPTAGEVLVGHGIVFDSWSVNLGGFVERIRPQAVNRLLAGGDVRSMWNHNSDIVLGRSGPRTMRFWKDSRGVVVSTSPPLWASNHMESVRRGDVTGMSFGFRAIEDEWTMDGNTPKRDLLDMTVSEFSVVAFPAYQATDVAVGPPQRSMALLQRMVRSARAKSA